jgi:hypothetical protein
MAVREGIALLTKQCHVSIFLAPQLLELFSRSCHRGKYLSRSKFHHHVSFHPLDYEGADYVTTYQLVCDSAAQISQVWDIFTTKEVIADVPLAKEPSLTPLNLFSLSK